MKTNTVLTIPKPGEIKLVDKPYPVRAAGYAIIKTAIAPVCLEGSRIFKDHDFEFHDDPEHLGHESVGTIVEVDTSSSFNVGDRVIVFQGEHCGQCPSCRNFLSPTYCDWNNPDIHGVEGSAMKGIEKRNNSISGGFAMQQYRLAPTSNIYRIPDEVSFEHAAACNCSFGVGFSNQEIMDVKAGDSVLVGGIGFIAMGHIISALYRNANVIALIRNSYRTSILQKMGVMHFVNPDDPDWEQQVRNLTYEKQGVDHAIDGSGLPYYQEKLIKAARVYGNINFSGHTPGAKLELSPLHHVIDPALTYQGQHDVREKDRERLIRALCDPIVQKGIDAMVTHQFPVERAAEAFQTQISKKCGKVYLTFAETN